MYKVVFLLVMSLFCCFGCDRKIPMEQPRIQLSYFKNENYYIGSVLNYPTDVENVLKSSSFSVFWKINGELRKKDIPSMPIFSTYSNSRNIILVVTMSGLYEISPMTGNLKQIELPETVNRIAVSSRQGDEIFVVGNYYGEDLCSYYNCLTGRVKTITTSSLVRGASFGNSKVFFNTEQKVFQFDIGLSATVEIGETRMPSSWIKGVWNNIPIFFKEENDEKSYLYWADVTVEFQNMLGDIGCNGELLLVVNRDNNIYKINKNGDREFVDRVNFEISGFGLLDTGIWVSSSNGRVNVYNNDGEKKEVLVEMPDS